MYVSLISNLSVKKCFIVIVTFANTNMGMEKTKYVETTNFLVNTVF
jgi:hypothetical protein